MTNPDQDSTTQRSATRAPVDQPIHLQFDDSMDVVEGMCRNISIGGMFVRVEKTRPRGSLVRFELQVGDSSTIRGLGEVVWSRSQSAGAEREAGIGIKFRFLEQRDRQLIFKLVSQHIKERLARRQPAGAAASAETAVEPPAAPPAAAAPPPEPLFAATPPAGGAAAAGEPAARASSATAAAASEPFPELTHEPLSALDPEPPELGAGAAGESPVGSGGLPPEAAAAPADLSGIDLESAGPPSGVDAAAIPTTASFLDAASEPASPPEPYGEEFPAEAHAPLEPEALPEPSGGSDEGGQRRRQVSRLLVLTLGLAALAAGLYLFREQLFEGFGDSSPPAVAVAGEPAPDLEPPATGVDAGTDAGEDGRGARDVGAAEVSREGEGAEVPPAVAPSPLAPSPPPALPPPPLPEPAGAELTRLVDVEWSAVPAGLEVVLVADGAIPAGRFRHFRLGGATPREVIQLVGVEEPFARTAFAVGGPGVEQIRTGYHRKSGGDELHIVLDLTGPEVSVREIRSSGRRLTVVIEVP